MSSKHDQQSRPSENKEGQSDLRKSMLSGAANDSADEELKVQTLSTLGVNFQHRFFTGVESKKGKKKGGFEKGLWGSLAFLGITGVIAVGVALTNYTHYTPNLGVMYGAGLVVMLLIGAGIMSIQAGALQKTNEHLNTQNAKENKRQVSVLSNRGAGGIGASNAVMLVGAAGVFMSGVYLGLVAYGHSTLGPSMLVAAGIISAMIVAVGAYMAKTEQQNIETVLKNPEVDYRSAAPSR